MISARADHGGGPAHLFLLCRHLHDRFDIFVALPQTPPYWERLEILLGREKLIPIPHRKFRFSSLFELRRQARLLKLDLIHSHGKGAGIYSRLLGMLTGVPVIHTFHGLHIGQYGLLSRAHYLLLERFLSTRSKALIAVSIGEAHLIAEHRIASASAIHTIENGIEFAPVQDRTPSSDLRLRVVTITRFDYAKNPNLLTRIIRQAASSFPDHFHFGIVGDGPGSASVRSDLSDLVESGVVTFHGLLDDPGEVLSSSDVYLSTSRWEGLPLSVLEAQSYCLAILATDVTGNRDLVQDGINGILYQSDSPEPAVQVLNRFAEDRELVARMGATGRQLVENRYNARRMAGETESIYRMILACRG
jgi:glycosyltransferase involved in cell wall biosynthesis